MEITVGTPVLTFSFQQGHFPGLAPPSPQPNCVKTVQTLARLASQLDTRLPNRLPPERRAARVRLLGGAGSDSHGGPGLGSVGVRMADFVGPQEFLEALREAEITTKPSSLLYVQALKFLETKATPPGARAARYPRRASSLQRRGVSWSSIPS